MHVVVFDNYGIFEDVSIWQGQSGAELHACNLMQTHLADEWDMGDEWQAEVASKINNLIVKEDYAGAIKFFNEQDDVRLEIFSRPINKNVPKPIIRDKSFFPGLEADLMNDWQDEVADGKTKLGFEEWKKQRDK